MMNKPLTIEQLKSLEVGDWVWVMDFVNHRGKYRQICKREEEGERFGGTRFSFSSTRGRPSYCRHTCNYGTEWLAYKNKEQAEGKDTEMIERIEKAYEHNIAECERCIKKVDMKHQFAMESMKEHIRKDTAKEILQQLIEWNKRETPLIADIQELAEKYNVGVEE